VGGSQDPDLEDNPIAGLEAGRNGWCGLEPKFPGVGLEGQAIPALIDRGSIL
jgi:hypothetical protein